MKKNLLATLPSTDWTPDHAQHLLNRAGFGAPKERVGHLAALTPRQAVSELIDYRNTPDPFSPPDFLPTREDYAEQRMAAREADSDEEKRKLARQLRAEERAAVLGLQAWWFERMTRTPRPLEEKMTLFWHGHFATSAQKVRVAAFNYQLNELFRQHATGNFKALTIAVGQSPAMLRYLDNVQNVKGHPNENWARELMELFTMGVDQYTEDDIKESARAFTGWTLDNGRFVFDLQRHDMGTKTFLGRTGEFDGWDILDIIFDQPVTAEFIVTQLWTYFAYENPEPAIVDNLAATLREYNYDIAPVLEQIFLSRAFYSDKAMGTQIKSPAQFLVQLAHHLELDPPPYQAMARASSQLGQSLFYPPNVAGWDGGRAWINANTLLMRYNMPKSIVVAELLEPDEMTMMDLRGMRQGMARRYQKAFRSTLKDMPPSQRREVQQRMKAADSREERRKVFENTLFTERADEAWDVRAIFAGLPFSTAGECVDALARRHLSVPLTDKQRRVVARTLTPTASLNAPLSPESLTTDQMTSALHLVFSLAEYQLC